MINLSGSLRDNAKQNQSTTRVRQERGRRFVELHYRRERLERELSAINNALIALDKQMTA